MQMLSPQDQAAKVVNKRFNEDFPFYARKHLKIRTKAGTLDPFVLNFPQEFVHKQIEQQRMATGRVRAVICKARQEGVSTYVGGRFYWRTTRNDGKATFILSHEADTTEKLFQIVERFHKNCPDAAKMQTDVANRRRMVFSGLNSEYFVGTAGNENVGRGGTIQYLHASEAAFYPDGDGFSKGLLQSVPDLSGTEIIIESTANGMDPLFYRMCMDAIKGIGEYILIFLPWFWMPEYRKETPLDFVPTVEEEKLARLYHLDFEQLYWRRMKIVSLKGDIKSFMQEYPCNVEEAFISTGESLISSFKFMEARKSTIIDPTAPFIIGIDGNESHGVIARSGFCFRRGRVIERAYALEQKKPMELVSYIADLIERNNPDKVFMDIACFAVIDRLYELGYEDKIIGIDFNDGPIQEAIYLNKRAEMWGDYADWLNAGGKRVPDDDMFHKESTAVPMHKKTSSGLKKLEPKEKIEDDKKIKLDVGDAAALTFAMPVRRNLDGQRRVKKINSGKPKLRSIARREGLQGNSMGSASVTLPIMR